jgi:hypothetical protein
LRIQNETRRTRCCRIESIELIVDEGTDVISLEDPRGAGLSVVDNIYIDGRYIRSGTGIAPGGDSGRDDQAPRRTPVSPTSAGSGCSA